MHRPFGFRFLIIVCIALAVLLAAVALVQYRWSKRVAAADAQREREHLETSAALFATQFNRAAIDAVDGFYRGENKVFESMPTEATKGSGPLNTMSLEFAIPLTGLPPGNTSARCPWSIRQAGRPTSGGRQWW